MNTFFTTTSHMKKYVPAWFLLLATVFTSQAQNSLMGYGFGGLLERKSTNYLSFMKIALVLCLFFQAGNVNAQTFTVTGGNNYLINTLNYEQYCGDITGFSEGVYGLVNIAAITITTSSPVTSISFILGSIGQDGYEVHRCDAIGTYNEVLSVPSSCSGLLTIVDNTVKNVNIPGVATRITVSSVTPFSQVVITKVSGSAALMLPSSLTVCNAGTSAPVLSATTAGTNCTIGDLSSLVTSTPPAGTTLRWYANNTATGSPVANPTAVGNGTYYAFYYDTTNNCASPASAAVDVNCCQAQTKPNLNN
jgi:hypothetical protein